MKNNKIKSKWKLGSKRGLSSIVGSVFFTILLTSVATYVIYSMNQIDKFGEAIVEKGQDTVNRNNEAFEITGVTKDNNKFNITIQNTGQLPVNITRLWIQNKTDPTWPIAKFSVNQIVAPGQTLTKIGQTLQLTAKPNQAYDISLVTDRGNTQEVLVNSASSKPLDMQLYVLPEKVPTGFSSTILFAVTNNMSNKAILTNLVPNLAVTTPLGASATLVSGPEPSKYATLGKGDTAYFKWIYNVSGNAGQKINFTASLQNGYFGNNILRDVTITNVQGIPTVKTIMGGGFNGTTTSSTQSFLKFFGDGRPNTSYDLKRWSMPINGTFQNLYVHKGTGTATITFTLYKASAGSSVGSNTILSCTTSSSSSTTCTDTNPAHAVSVVAGETVAMGIKLPVGASASGDITFSVEFDPN